MSVGVPEEQIYGIKYILLSNKILNSLRDLVGIKRDIRSFELIAWQKFASYYQIEFSVILS